MSGAVAQDPAGIQLRAGSASAPADPAALLPMLDRANAARRVPGVPDTLNLAVIDPTKAAAFASALPHLPAETRAQLAGRSLLLDGAGLGVSAASPVPASAFARPFSLVIDEVQGDTVLARTDAAPDLALARARAGEAEQALAAAPAGPDGDARWRRLTLARAWRHNAALWAAGVRDDPAAADSLRRAEAAMRDNAMAPRGGTVRE